MSHTVVTMVSLAPIKIHCQTWQLQ